MLRFKVKYGDLEVPRKSRGDVKRQARERVMREVTDVVVSRLHKRFSARISDK